MCVMCGAVCRAALLVLHALGTCDFIRGCPRACACELRGRMGHLICEVIPTAVRLTAVFLTLRVIFFGT